ncbi:3' terminal RNA ribose 2'-O-methyltransferase Hen1 [Bradymonas sediminis]|uniref:Small RNA 2'-O-methyltransferase n=1 Tax=Bradymonas sediminis TaxID=1548548 RepID=A0A2Z4FIH6_9DELT|nr:3' terminal RNA ribose 2'-O-methyltransferase Hen1 [Bradymonas sediminis]AWV88713.1 3' terminal RNA ribose 2'-O-methyltransferase Hen1 [Bradymonas sediminis]TDP63595.1 3' terminal RNA ribose 2'-O-methyltransferase Hen1 [Bradymonas sediminis]
MLFTISTTHQPATDLGYLLYKHPERAQTFDISSGKAHVFYPEASAQKCTAAMVLEMDTVKLVRGSQHARRESWTLGQYVNDRPYVASSFLSVAFREVFGSAMGGNCKERPGLAETPIPLEVHLSAVPCPGDGSLIAQLFEPLGYAVEATRLALDPAFPEWGESAYFAVTLTGEQCVADMLSHIYVLAPVLDGDKHYWVGEDEVEKLLRHGEGWLEGHPRLEYITRRYLKYQRGLAADALEELAGDDEDDEGVEDDIRADAHAPAAETPEKKVALNTLRLQAVEDVLVKSGARTVLDLGCGEGKLLKRLRARPQFEKIMGVDVAHRELERAARKLKLAEWPDFQDERVVLRQSSLLYRDRRLEGFDAAVLVEVIEHMDLPKLATLEGTVFEHARPSMVVVTTPNREFNAQYENLNAGHMRHQDHRFEWSREEFAAWADGVAQRNGYRVAYRGIGEKVEGVGTPTQMAVFKVAEEDANE